MSNYFRFMHVPEELGNTFIDVFTRMEYALKASGEYADGNADSVRPAWTRFANAIDAPLRALQDRELQSALEYLRESPVRKQTKRGFGRLPLDSKQSETQRTMHVVRTVRNNIFHGGKIQIKGEVEKGRNEKLVSACLTVLNHASGLIPAVRTKFQEAGARS
jgi:hypothetical protein